MSEVAFVTMYTTFFRLVVETHGGCHNLHDGFLQNLNRHGISLWSKDLSCLLPDPCEELRSSPSNGMQEKTIVLFVSNLCHCFQRLEGHDWNYMSLLWDIVHVPSTEKLSYFPLNTGFLSFMTLVTDPLSTTSLRALKFPFSSCSQYEVSLQFLIAYSLVTHCFEQFLDRTRPTQSEAEQNPVILTSIFLPGPRLEAFHSLIMVHDPILHPNLGHRHSPNS